MPENKTMKLLRTKPLAEAVREALNAGRPALIQEQIEALEKQLNNKVPRGTRAHLTEALANLNLAARQATLPVQNEIAEAVNDILRTAGVNVAPAGKRKSTSRRRRISEDVLGEHVVQALPPDTQAGLSGKMLAKECGISYQTLRRHLDSFQNQGLIVRQGKGAGTTWHRGKAIKK